MRQSYIDVTRSSLRLPANTAWPPVDQEITPNTPLIEGFGATIGQSFWRCSWIRVLGSGATAAERRQALNELLTIKSLQIYRSAYDDQTRAVTDSELLAAQKGDTRLFLKDYRVNCAPDNTRH